MEDKICDLYDLYIDVYSQLSSFSTFLLEFAFSCGERIILAMLVIIQGLDEETGPQIRKLYSEVFHLATYLCSL